MIILSGNALSRPVNGENCSQIVCDILLKEKTKLSVSPPVIQTSNRLGKRPISQQPDERSSSVELCRRDMKSDIMHACHQLQLGMFVNGSLTETRCRILYVLSEVTAPRKSLQLWIPQCPRIGTGKPQNPDTPVACNSRMFMNTQLRLHKFCAEILETPLSTYVEN